MPSTRLQGISRCRVCAEQIFLAEASNRWRHVPPIRDEHAAIRAYLPKPMERAAARQPAVVKPAVKPRKPLSQAKVREARITAAFIARNRVREPDMTQRPKSRSGGASSGEQINDRFFRNRVRKTAFVPTAKRLGLGPVMKAGDET